MGMVPPIESNICETKFSSLDGMMLGGPPTSSQTTTTRMPVTGSRGLFFDVGSMTPAEKDDAIGNRMLGAWRNGAATGLSCMPQLEALFNVRRKITKDVFYLGLGR